MALSIISNAPTAAFSENSIPIIVETDNFLDVGSARPNFSICLVIQFESELNSNNYDKVVTLCGIPPIETSDPSTRRIVFDIAKVLDNLLMEELGVSLNLPSINASFFINTPANLLHQRFRRWKATIYEEYGTPPTQSNSATITTRHIYQGGVSDIDRNEQYYLSKATPIVEIFSFFDKKRLLPNQADFVTLYNGFSDTFLSNLTFENINIKITHIDNTTSSIPFPSTFPTQLGRNQAWMFPVGYTQLGFNTITPDVKSWQLEFILENPFGDQTIVNSPTYYLDCRNYECKEFIWYINSFGSFETVHLTGVWEDSLKTKKTNYSSPRDVLNDMHDNRTVTIKVDKEQRFRARTGYHDKASIRHLKQMLSGKIVFWQQNEMIAPIIIDAATIKIEECLEVLHALTFSFKPARSMGNYDLKTEKLGTV